MSGVLRTLGRLILIPIAFVLSAIAAGFVLFTLGMERVTHAMKGRGADGDMITAMFDLALQAQFIASALTIVPAILLVIVGEVARIRSALYYVLGGGLSLAAIPFLAVFQRADSIFASTPAVWQVFATAGFAGGLVYWLIAGRNA